MSSGKLISGAPSTVALNADLSELISGHAAPQMPVPPSAKSVFIAGLEPEFLRVHSQTDPVSPFQNRDSWLMHIAKNALALLCRFRRWLGYVISAL
jgi:hypothetical protein